MRILRSLEEAANRQSSSAVTIGSFDGIHLAHRELLARIRRKADETGASAVAITFDPHPLQLLAPDKAPKLITPMPIRLELFEQAGVDELLLIPFTRALSLWSPARFIEEVLVKALHASSVFVGDSFHFGHNQAGTPETIMELGRRFGYETEILPKMAVRGVTISSSEIRRLLKSGRISKANRLLGHPFAIQDKIETGLGIGNRETVPTLNIEGYPDLLPANGVYITRAKLLDQSADAATATSFPSVTNVGDRPTFKERGLGVETHLLCSWPGGSPSRMEVEFLYRLRDERKFEDAGALKSQILKDVHRSLRYFHLLELLEVSLR